jgi:hypothetical protein
MQLRLNFTGAAKRVTRNGREYLVANVVSIVPGVLPGSKGPALYTPDECARNAPAWDMARLTLYHPKANGEYTSSFDPAAEHHHVGHFRNSRFDGRLTHEAWADVAKLRKADKRFGTNVEGKLERGEPIDVSTGLFTDDEHIPGTYNGVAYDFVVKNFRPDHIAILPGEKGACSRDRGCGINVNESSEATRNAKYCTKQAAAATIATEHKGARDHAMAAMDSTGGKDAAKEHEAAAEMHEQAATDARREDKPDLASAHDQAAALHRRAASVHASGVANAAAAPSDSIDPDKACTMLKDGTANGKPLTEAQRGMLGAACGKAKKNSFWSGLWNLLSGNREELVDNTWTDEARKASADARSKSIEAEKMSKGSKYLSGKGKAAVNEAQKHSERGSGSNAGSAEAVLGHRDASFSHASAASAHGYAAKKAAAAGDKPGEAYERAAQKAHEGAAYANQAAQVAHLNAQGKHNSVTANEDTTVITRKQAVQQLIANCNGCDDEQKQAINALPDVLLSKLVLNAGGSPNPTNAGTVVDSSQGGGPFVDEPNMPGDDAFLPKPTVRTLGAMLDLASANGQHLTEKQFLQLAPPSIRALLTSNMDKERKELTDRLTANVAGDPKAKEAAVALLNKKSIEDLQLLALLVPQATPQRMPMYGPGAGDPANVNPTLNAALEADSVAENDAIVQPRPSLYDDLVAASDAAHAKKTA